MATGGKRCCSGQAGSKLGRRRRCAPRSECDPLAKLERRSGPPQLAASLAADDRQLAEELLTMAMREAARAHRHALMLVLTAQERVKAS
jgi:hypothetical protein